jgi:hypothetical protein
MTTPLFVHEPPPWNSLVSTLMICMWRWCQGFSFFWVGSSFGFNPSYVWQKVYLSYARLRLITHLWDHPSSNLFSIQVPPPIHASERFPTPTTIHLFKKDRHGFWQAEYHSTLDREEPVRLGSICEIFKVKLFLASLWTVKPMQKVVPANRRIAWTTGGKRLSPDNNDPIQTTVAANAFVQVIVMLRMAFVQDSVLIVEFHPCHPNCQHSIFPDPAYLSFKRQVNIIVLECSSILALIC